MSKYVPPILGELCFEGGHLSDVDKNILILMVGLPRSGKSYWAERSGLPIVSRDAIRLALHGQPYLQQAEDWVSVIENTFVLSLFEAGHKAIVIDATHTSQKRRDRWLDDRWACFYHCMGAGIDKCVERAKADDREDLIPVINRMHSAFQPLTEKEHQHEIWLDRI